MPLSFHGLPQKSRVDISEEDIRILSQEAHPRCLFNNAFLYLKHLLSSRIGIWVSGLPEFLVHVNQIVSSDVGLLIVLVFLGIYCFSFHQKKFWWNYRFHRLILWGKLKCQNHTFFFSSISSFELYNSIDVMSSVLIAVIKMPGLSHINCQIKMTQPWPNG